MGDFDPEQMRLDIEEYLENDEESDPPEDIPQNESLPNANTPEFFSFGLLSSSLIYNVINPTAEDAQVTEIRQHLLEAMKSSTQQNILIEHAPGLHGTALTLTLVLENLRQIQRESEGIQQASCSSIPTSKQVFLCTNHQTFKTFKIIQDIQSLSDESRRLQDFQIVYLHETKVQSEGQSTQGKPVYSACKVNHLPQDILQQLQHPYLPIPPSGTQHDLNLEILEHADVIICNQKFILSPILRRILRIRLENSILIFHDGHNLVDACRNILTLSLTELELEIICHRIKNLQQSQNFLNNPDPDPEVVNEQRVLSPVFTQLVNKLPDLLEWLRSQNVAERSNGPILTQLKKLGFGFNQKNLTELATKFYNQFRSNDHDHDQDSEPNLKFDVLEKLPNLLLILPALFQGDGINFGLNVEVHGRDKKVKTLKICCAIADLIFKPVGAMASTVIIGGHSLAPYSDFDTGFQGFGLGVNFPLLLQIFYRNEKSKNRFLFTSTSYGPRRSPFHLNYKQRNGAVREVVEALCQICSTVPNGVVVLFHSKAYLQNRLLVPPANGLIAQLERVCNKHVICELYVQNEPPAQVMERFKRLSKNQGEGKTGAIFISLHRGSFYPNMDLCGPEVRATVHVSMPFGDSVNGDDHTTMRKFFRAINPQNESLADGMWSIWNNKECIRMLNQSFPLTYQGSEENEDEWGMVIVLDSIFANHMSDLFDLTPFWVEQCTSRHLSSTDGFQQMMGHVRRLVTTMNTVGVNHE